MDDTDLFALHAGEILDGRYIIRSVLGIGGFAITYRAYDRVLEADVAIKEYFPADCAERAGRSGQVICREGENNRRFQEGMGRFKQETIRTAALQGRHNIVDVYGCFEQNGTAYMTMEFLRGRTLSAYLHSMPNDRLTDMGEVIRIAYAVAEGLAYIHDKDLLHRDISPDNIFMLDNGAVKIIDFGAAREGNAEMLSIVVKTGCTPPEQYRRFGKQGPWTDIYAFGATIYRMVTGQYPLASLDREGSAAEKLPAPSSYNSAVPEYLDALILRCLAMDYRLRLSTAAEIMQVLDAQICVESAENIAKRRRRVRLAAGAGATGGAVVILVICLVVFFQANTLYAAKLSECTLIVEIPEGFSSGEGLAAVAAGFTEAYPQVTIQFVLESEAKNPDIMLIQGEDTAGCLELTALRKVKPTGNDYYEVIAYDVSLYFADIQKASASNEVDSAQLRLGNVPDNAITTDYSLFRSSDTPYYIFYGSISSYKTVQEGLSALCTVCSRLDDEPIPIQMGVSSESASQTAALRFLLYLSDEAAQQILFVEHGGMIPAESNAQMIYFETYDEFDFVQQAFFLE